MELTEMDANYTIAALRIALAQLTKMHHDGTSQYSGMMDLLVRLLERYHPGQVARPIG